MISNKNTKIVVSGMMRSGTTLLQRVLDAHPAIHLEYQTKTKEFIDIKNKFLKQNSINSYHSLWHYSQDVGYSFNDFQKWLKVEGIIGGISLTNTDHTVFLVDGVKEVLMEEFYPSLIINNILCLNIIRDPRDVIASMSFGDGQKYTGRNRPVLFDLRNWRKSVHISHKLRHEFNFKNILFENLIIDKISTVSQIFSWLGVKQISVNILESKINNSDWFGNSSFGEKKPFDRNAIGTYLSKLPQSVCDYIEATCFYEMKYLGYSLNISSTDRESIISNYKDPFEIFREEFESDYSSTLKNIDYELNRIEKNFLELNEEFFA